MRSTNEEFGRALKWHLEPFYRPTDEPWFVPVEVHEYDDHQHDHDHDHDHHRAHDEEVVLDADEGPLYRYERGLSPQFTGPIAGALSWALWDMHALVPKLSRDFLFLHAGAVARDEGALLLPAAMDTGKSTLTAALLTQGFDYLSDELGPVDPITGQIFAFPKRISLDATSLELFPGVEERLEDRVGLSASLRERYARPEDFGARIGGPVPARWIVFPTPDREGAPRLTPLSSAEAVELMARNLFNLSVYRERGAILLARVAREARAFRLDGGSSADRARLLGESLT